MQTFHPGEKVVTRRGKYGVVIEERSYDEVDVRFGPNIYTMRVGQLVSARAYDRMMRGKPVPGQNIGQ